MVIATRPGGDWVGPPEACKLLGVTPRTLYRFIDHEDLPAYQIGQHIRLRRSEIAAWLEARETRPDDLRYLYPLDGGADDEDGG